MASTDNVNRLRAIEELGQSVWIDNLNRELLDEGALLRLIEEDGISGVTSNPTIFEKGMGDSDRYDDAFRAALEETDDTQEIFERLAHADVRDAADLLRPTFDGTEGRDGYVSFELPAALAHDASGSVEAAQSHRERIDRPNVLIKVPGTDAGVRGLRGADRARRERERDAAVRGVALRADRRGLPARDRAARGRRRARGPRRLGGQLLRLARGHARSTTRWRRPAARISRGQAAVANAKLAYESFRRIFSGERWERLAAAGAAPQRPLWGSTSTKNPDYPDTLYVDELIGPDTVNTMPDATIEAARERATPERTIDRDVERAHRVMEEIEAAGVDVDDIVLRQLPDEGVEAFAESYRSLLETLERKAADLAPTRG